MEKAEKVSDARLDPEEKSTVYSPTPNRARIEIKLTSASPRKARNALLQPSQFNLNLLSVMPERGPLSPGSKGANSCSRPMSPDGSPRGEPMSTSMDSALSSSSSLSSSDLGSSSMSLSSSTDTLPKKTEAQDPINHLALIADGHRRWAKEQGVANEVAYAHSAEVGIPEITRDVFSMDVKTFTVWLFSIDNWKRESDEVQLLMKYFDILVDKLLPIAHELKFRIVHLGNKEKIPAFLLKKLKQAEEETSQYPDRIVNLAISAGGQDDIVRAIKKLAKTKNGDDPFDFENVSAEDITGSMDTGGQKYPAPDLIIRTTVGDHKLSGFMSWFPYAKINFTECYCPDLKKKHIEKAFLEFAERPRNYGQ
jgi:undecaprenyl diphosphate synthase